MTTFDEASVLYRTYLKVTRRRARSTVATAMRLTESFAAWLGYEYEIETTQELTADHLEAYVTESFKTTADGTYNMYMGHLRRWAQWLGMENLLGVDQSPWRKLVPRERPQPRRQKQFLSGDVVSVLAEAANDWHPRDKFYVQLSYDMGRRWSEITAMRIRNIDFNARPGAKRGMFVFDNIKGRKPVTALPIRAELETHLREWLAIYAKLIGRPLRADDYLIPAVKRGSGRPIRGVRASLRVYPGLSLPYPSARDILKRASALAGLDEKAVTHGLRRGRLDDLNQETGGNIRAVKTYAGHATERTSEEYIDFRREVKELGDLFDSLDGDSSTPVEPDKDDTGVVVSLFERRAARNRA
jgi:integrase